jgi:hypothetical protein
LSGRLKVTQVMPLSFSTSSVSYFLPALISLPLLNLRAGNAGFAARRASC